MGFAAAAAVSWPGVLRAQQRVKPVIGFLRSSTAADSSALVAAFRQGLRAAGYVESDNVAVEYRWADNQAAQLPALAADLVRRKVDVIVANQASTPAAKTATATIPIVFVIGGDPVDLGFVSSLGRPTGNLTGVTFLSETLEPKRLEMLRELKPKASKLAALINANSPNAKTALQALTDAARAIGVQLRIASIRSERDLEPAFAGFARERVDGLAVSADALLTSLRGPIVTLAARYAIPTIYSGRESVVAGGLLSYAPSQAAAYRRAASYVGRILKGARTTDLPVEQSAELELVANLKTAKTLGIVLPPTLRLRMNEIID